MIAGALSDRFGRKPILILAGALFFISALGSTIAPTFYLLIIARLIGGLGVGMDADVTVLDLERGRAVMGIALGTVIMVDGVVVGRGGTILTTEKGVKTVKAFGLPYDVIDLNQCGLYT